MAPDLAIRIAILKRALSNYVVHGKKHKTCSRNSTARASMN